MTEKKEPSPGRIKFVNMLNEMKRQTRPGLSAAWEGVPVGYRRLLAGLAGVSELAVTAPLFTLSEDQRRRLMVANTKLTKLAVECGATLSGSLTRRP